MIKYLLLFLLPLLLSCGMSNRPTVVLTFDDAVISHYTNVAPMLKEYGFGATFFVCEFPRKQASDSLEYMTWQQISELEQLGFEIGNHTRNHKHVDRMTKKEMHEQLAYIEAKCKKYGITKPISFAYPGYDTDSVALIVLDEMGYKYARSGGKKAYIPEKHHPLLIPSFSTTGEDEKAKRRVMDILQNAKPGEILVFTIHGVPDTVHPHVNTAPELFKLYLDYMKDHHFKVIAMKDLAKHI